MSKPRVHQVFSMKQIDETHQSVLTNAISGDYVNTAEQNNQNMLLYLKPFLPNQTGNPVIEGEQNGCSAVAQEVYNLTNKSMRPDTQVQTLGDSFRSDIDTLCCGIQKATNEGLSDCASKLTNDVLNKFPSYKGLCASPNEGLNPSSCLLRFGIDVSN